MSIKYVVSILQKKPLKGEMMGQNFERRFVVDKKKINPYS
jgi:hypothetical protein